jgi:hypothetical protein
MEDELMRSLLCNRRPASRMALMLLEPLSLSGVRGGNGKERSVEASMGKLRCKLHIPKKLIKGDFLCLLFI